MWEKISQLRVAYECWEMQGSLKLTPYMEAEMSKVGAHLMIWTSKLDEDTVKIFDRVKEIGFDGVEIPLVNPMDNRI